MVEKCYRAYDLGFYYRGTVNVTNKGPCEPWSTWYKYNFAGEIAEKYNDYSGLDENYCRNSVAGNVGGYWWDIEWVKQQKEPWCMVQNHRVKCGIPQCGKYMVHNQKVNCNIPLCDKY